MKCSQKSGQIKIAAGRNGLIIACCLARVGLDVLVGGVAGVPGRAAAKAVLNLAPAAAGVDHRG